MQAENYTSPKDRAEISAFLDQFGEYRAAADLTEEQAAQRIGYSRSWIQKMKSYDVVPKKKAWDALRREAGGLLNKSATSPIPEIEKWRTRAEAAEAKLAALKAELTALLKKI